MHYALVRISAGIALALALAHPANAQSTTRVSVDSSGAQANGASSSASISFDGRYVAYSSRASNLVAGDTNGFDDIFFHDRVSGSTTLLSSSWQGTPSNGPSFGPEIAFDGGWVVWYSAASNLVLGDTNGKFDAFIRQDALSATSRWSVGAYPALTEGNDDSTKCLRSSPSGSAFQSRATNLVSGDLNGFQDVFVYSSSAFGHVLASVSTGGVQGNGDSYLCAMPASGSFIAFRSSASNLVTGDTNAVDDIFLRDPFWMHTTKRASVSTNGTEANGPSSDASLDRDGVRVAFASRASNLVANDTNGAPDIFVRDLVTGVTTRVSVASNGTQSNGASAHPAIAGFGHHVAFYSEASNLVPSDNNAHGDVFVRDLQAGTTTRVSIDSSGVEGLVDSGAEAIRITWDGRFVMFDSLANNLVVGDTNGVRDIFVHDCGGSAGTYCTSGTSTHGCVASISSSGIPSASSSSGFAINVYWVEWPGLGGVFYGTSGQAASPWGIGSTSTLCVPQPLQRTPLQNTGGSASWCTNALTLDWNAYITSHPGALGVPFSVGQHVYAQVWFRDQLTVKGTNLSDALEFVVGP